MAAKFGIKLVDGFLVPVTAASAGQVGTSLDRFVIVGARMHNYGTTPESFSVWILPKGVGAVSDQYQAIDAAFKQIAPGETIMLFENGSEPIPEGGSIWAEASTVTKLTFSVWGTSFTS